MSNIFKEYYQRYLDSGYSVIPDRFKGKTPLIKGWSDWCRKVPTADQCQQWGNDFDKSNIAVCMGEASGIIALDLDTVKEEILDLILPMLPHSPVSKVGSKGETRFFQYRKETTAKIEFGGECILEILSTGKKTTIPPSVHPNGMAYTWKDDVTLLDIKKSDLPLLPPMLIAHIEDVLRTKFAKQLVSNGAQLTKHNVTGRNNTLSSLCGKLIKERMDLSEAIAILVDTDQRENSPPLFTDPNEFRHTQAHSNALAMYTNVLNTVNTKHFRNKEMYEVPVLKSTIEQSLKEQEELGKSQGQEDAKKLNKIALCSVHTVKQTSLPSASGYLKTLQEYILSNSVKKQPSFAMGAALACMSTMLGQRYVFNNTAPNLFVYNIGGTGAGKQAPIDYAKHILTSGGHLKKIGGDDYASNASLMDHLSHQNVRLDLLDEKSSILEVASKSDGGYTSGMSGTLCKLWSGSNGEFGGRQLAPKDIKCSNCKETERIERRGDCYRPQVNILMSTTPTDLEANISLKALRTGVLGRFLIMLANDTPEINANVPNSRLDEETCAFLNRFNEAALEQNDKYKKHFVKEVQLKQGLKNEYDRFTTKLWGLGDDLSPDDPLHAVVARLPQQFNKIALCHAAGRMPAESIEIGLVDLQFAYEMCLHILGNFSTLISKYLDIGEYSKEYRMVKAFLEKYPEGTSDRNIRFHLRNHLRAKTIENVLCRFEESGEVERSWETGEPTVKLTAEEIKNED